MKKSIFTFIMMIFLVISSFAQAQKEVTDNVTIVKTNFPKIYSVIVNEAKSNYPGDYVLQKDMIGAQCLAFSVFVVLIYTDPPTIPRQVLTDIQIQSIKKHCKNYTMDTRCEQITDSFSKIDCNLSYMIIDWISTMLEMEKQIKVYKELNKPL